jgi:hypothetical protein
MVVVCTLNGNYVVVVLVCQILLLCTIADVFNCSGTMPASNVKTVETQKHNIETEFILAQDTVTVTVNKSSPARKVAIHQVAPMTTNRKTAPGSINKKSDDKSMQRNAVETSDSSDCESEEDDSDFSYVPESNDEESEHEQSDNEAYEECDSDFMDEICGVQSSEVKQDKKDEMLEGGSSREDEKHITKKEIKARGQNASENIKSPAEQSVFVSSVTRKQNEKRNWDKRHYCKYCHSSQSKISRHLERAHADEIDVAAALCHPKGSKQRKAILERVRKMGDYEHNFDVLQNESGSLVTCRRPQAQCSGFDYDMCEFCYGFYVSHAMWKHRKMCHLYQLAKSQGKVVGRRVHGPSNLSLLPVSSGASAGLAENVLSRLNHDKVSHVVKQDKLITSFGSHLFQKHGQSQVRYITQRLRELARLMLTVRDKNPDIRSLDICIDPKKFNEVVESVRLLCGYDESTRTYKIPSLALKIGYSLKGCARILQATGLKDGRKDLQKRAKEFAQLCEMEWHAEVSSAALVNLREQKFNKPDMLPLAADVKRLFEYLETSITETMNDMEEKFTSLKWTTLCRLTLAYVVLFNRRRGGEMERLTLSTYSMRLKTEVPDDYACGLSKFEKLLCDKLERIEMRGKKGRKVAVLLTEFITKPIGLLVKYRKQAGVDDNNPYLFARCNFSSLEPQRSSECLRLMAEAAGVSNRDSITSTKLRKQIATQLQLLALKDNELDVIADFLGHDIRVHRQFYRLSEGTLQLAKVSKVFLAAERGDLHKFQGKSLDEIEPGCAGIYAF